MVLNRSTVKDLYYHWVISNQHDYTSHHNVIPIWLRQLPKVNETQDSSETQVSSSILRKLFPPPPNLIKEKFNNNKEVEKNDENFSKELVKDKEKKNEDKEEKIKDSQVQKKELAEFNEDKSSSEEEGKKEK